MGTSFLQYWILTGYNYFFLDFQYKGLVDVAILHLQEAGVLTALENTWWVENDNEQHCKVSIINTPTRF